MSVGLRAESASPIDEGAIQTFRMSLGGALLQPGDEGYETARRTFNAMIDKRPALIARCAGTGDVIKAVRFAREHDLLVSVRGGGHNVAGNAVCDGGLMIDLSPMKGIRVDPVTRTVRAQTGLTWREFDRECQVFGLATTGGLISTTGIAGLTLGGGVGWLGRSHGLACDNLISADVVLADGTFVTASASEHADLFWGLRGGGGNFGVVTSFEYRLHPVSTLLGGMLLYPIEQAKDVLRFYREFSLAAPDELSTLAVLMTVPDIGSPVVAIPVCYTGPIEQGEAVIQPLREFGPPLADLTGPMPYEQIQTLMDEGFPFGVRNYWKSSFLVGLPDEAIDTIVDHFAAVPSPLSAVAVEQFGGAYRRVGREETAFCHRDWDYNLLIISRWQDAAEDEQQVRWTRDLWQAVQPASAGGVYVNYLEEGQEGADRIRAAYGPNYDRLVALKNQYDPTNFFRRNQNIAPAP
jgi:FAD/FMN-containing dehydrogenase